MDKCSVENCDEPRVYASKSQCRVHYNALMREYNKKPAAREARLNRGLLRRYGITRLEYLALLAHQGGGCAICQGPPNGRHAALHVDHDHKTGKVRGLLCSECNLALGKMQDDVKRLRRMIDYLLETN